MLKWFNPKEFLNTHQEFHALVIGWGDGVAFTKTDWRLMGIFYGEEEKMEQEFHYFKFGLALGRLTWALIIALLLIRFIE